MRSLRALAPLPSLHTLDASNNAIAGAIIAPLPEIDGLTEFPVHGDPEDMAPAFASLESLVLRGNPLLKQHDARALILPHAPRLQLLDDRPIGAMERRCLVHKMKLQGRRKSDGPGTGPGMGRGGGLSQSKSWGSLQSRSQVLGAGSSTESTGGLVRVPSNSSTEGNGAGHGTSGSNDGLLLPMAIMPIRESATSSADARARAMRDF